MKNIIKDIATFIGFMIIGFIWVAIFVVSLIGTLEMNIICDIVFAACIVSLVILLCRNDMKNSRT